MRRSHPETVLLWSVLLTAAVARAGHAERLTLVRDGQATSAIVLAVKPTRAAQFAAAELQYHLRKMTGATVPVVTDANPAPSTAVLVGESAATRALGLTNDGFGPQEYLIGFRPGALVLMGHDAADLRRLHADVLRPVEVGKKELRGQPETRACQKVRMGARKPRRLPCAKGCTARCARGIALHNAADALGAVEFGYQPGDSFVLCHGR